MNEARIQRLIDEDDIKKTLLRYARGMDRHDEDLIASAYFEDGVDVHGKFVGSPKELAKWGNELHSVNTRGHQHNLTNIIYHWKDDHVLVETYLIFVLDRRDGDLVDVSGARYFDRFEKRDGEWRIAIRNVIMDWSVEASRGTDVKNTLRHYHKGQWTTSDLSYQHPTIESPKN